MAMWRCAGATPTTFLPAMRSSPSEGSSRPAMMLSSVDLPQPEGPTRIRNSPGATSISIFLRTSTALSPLPKTLRMPAIWREAAIFLSFHRAGGETFHEVLTCQYIDQHGGKTGNHGRSHVDVVALDAAGGVGHVVQAHGDGLAVGAAEGHAKQEVVPDVGKSPDERHHQDGRGHGHHDAEEDAPEAGTVNARSVDQFFGNGGVVVAEEQRGSGQTCDAVHQDQTTQ